MHTDEDVDDKSLQRSRKCGAVLDRQAGTEGSLSRARSIDRSKHNMAQDSVVLSSQVISRWMKRHGFAF
jgi:hypothetical protein